MKKRINNIFLTLKFFAISFFGSRAKIFSASDTLNYALNNKMSIIRFGDGEFNLMNGKSIHYQDYSNKINDELKLIYSNYLNKKSNYILCVPRYYMKCNGIKLLKSKVLVSSWSFSRYYFQKNFNQYIKYGDAFCFSKKNLEVVDEFFRKLTDMECIFVHNNVSYSIQFEKKYNIKTHFVSIPKTNAYSSINSIIFEIKNKITDNSFVLVSAGPCGKVITRILSESKVFAIDCGHLWDDPLI